MKRIISPLILIALIICSAIFSACNRLDDNFSTNPNHRLSFSTDTLSFDTVFTSIGSATKQFMIYNKNKEPLNIETIMLAGAETTGFRINVDGRKGDYFNNIPILEEDSLFVLVEVTVDPNGKNQPMLVEDSVVFVTNGIKQVVNLEAFGQDVHLMKGGVHINKDTVFKADKPYLVYDSIVINNGATLQLEKGVSMYMHDKANIISYGTLKSCGTMENPVIIRGDRLDFILNDVLPYDRTPGQWGGIFLKNSSFNNSLSHTIIRNGTTGVTAEASNPDNLKLTVSNSQITNMSENAFSAINCKMVVYNSEITNAGGSVVALVSGDYNFAHCTLANFITLVQRTTVCLALANNYSKDGNTVNADLNANFDNCIIDGSYGAGTDKLNGEIAMSENDAAQFNYLFNHCVVTTNGENNEHFQSVIFANDESRPVYKLKGGEKNKYQYDFRIAEETSVGVGKADPAVSASYPIDRLGVKRLESVAGPTIGAYEYVPEEEK